ncbi:MAG: hypothetical protein MK074_01100 [Phycisphaerales bacterium]|nr:hypothetical protein [Phycisphaerales bacterium]
MKHLSALLLGLSLCVPCGCNIAGAVDKLTTPDAVVEAKFHPDNVPTAVFIDDRRNQVNPVRLRRAIADMATRILIDEGDMTEMISPRDAMAAARQLDGAAEPSSVSAIGKAIGARQVIYVEVVAFRITRDGLTPDPLAYFNVRVLDLEAGERVFPTDAQFEASAGYPLQVTIPPAQLGTLTGQGSPSLVRRALADRAGDALGRLFVDTGYSAGGDRLIDVEPNS